MKLQLEKFINRNDDLFVINKTLEIVSQTTTLADAYAKIDAFLGKALFFQIGEGGSHIWIKNGNGERIAIITENN